MCLLDGVCVRLALGCAGRLLVFRCASCAALVADLFYFAMKEIS